MTKERNQAPVLFATSPQDARQTAISMGLEFEDVVWVLNTQLLGTEVDRTGAPVYYSQLFRAMPAYREALALYGDGEAGGTIQ